MIQDFFTLFFDPAQRVAFAINAVLVALTVGTLGRIIRDMGLLTVERAELSRFRDGLKKLPHDRTPDARLHRRRELEELHGSKRSRSLASERISDLLTLGETDRVDIEGLSGLSSEAVAGRLGFARAIGPILILLGLLGTLWGLAHSVTELSAILDVRDFTTARLREAIGGTLGGMKTAFSTTLMGVVGTVLVRAAVGLAGTRYQLFLMDLERFLITAVVPLFEVSERTALPEAAAALTALQKDLDADLKALVSSVSEEGQRLVGELNLRFDGMEEAFNQRAAQLLGETGQAMSAVMRLLGDTDPNTPSLAEYVSSVQLVTADLERSVSTASDLIPSMQDSLRATIAAHHESLYEALRAYADRVEPILEKQSEAADSLVRAAEGSATSMERLEAQLAELNSSFQVAKRSWENLDRMFEAQSESTRQALTEGLRDVVAELKTERRMSEEERQRMSAALEAFQSSLRETLARLHEERSAAQQRSEELLETVRAVLTGGIARIVETNEKGREEQSGEFVRAIREMTHEIRDLGNAMESGRGQKRRAAQGKDWEWPRRPDGAAADPGEVPPP